MIRLAVINVSGRSGETNRALKTHHGKCRLPVVRSGTGSAAHIRT